MAFPLLNSEKNSRINNMAQSPADKVIAFLVANAGKEINAAGADYFIDALEPRKADWPRRVAQALHGRNVRYHRMAIHPADIYRLQALDYNPISN